MKLARHNFLKKSVFRRFLESESAGGLLLIIAAIFALLITNSKFAHIYYMGFSKQIGPFSIASWINESLMTLFFLIVGLEIKREWIEGHLSTWADRRLPIIAAIAGMALPALLYGILVQGQPALWRGWAIPVATDIAFALAILSLAGNRIPASLKLLLTTIAIVDDIGAVSIIALFYTAHIDLTALIAAAASLGAMFALNRAGVRALWPYVLLFLGAWAATLLSGVHPTIAGVIAAFTIPHDDRGSDDDSSISLLHMLEGKLAKPVAYIILPLFGFANAGVTLNGTSLFSALPFAIGLGLFLGKQWGVFIGIWLAVKCGIASKPAGATWAQIYGLAVLCGIGFTMSLFIGGLAFVNGPHSSAVKTGVLLGSVASALLGFVILRWSKEQPDSEFQD